MANKVLFEAWATVPKIGRYGRKSRDLTGEDLFVYTNRRWAIRAAKDAPDNRVAKKVQLIELNDY